MNLKKKKKKKKERLGEEGGLRARFIVEDREQPGGGEGTLVS